MCQCVLGGTFQSACKCVAVNRPRPLPWQLLKQFFCCFFFYFRPRSVAVLSEKLVWWWSWNVSVFPRSSRLPVRIKWLFATHSDSRNKNQKQ